MEHETYLTHSEEDRRRGYLDAIEEIEDEVKTVIDDAQCLLYLLWDAKKEFDRIPRVYYTELVESADAMMGSVQDAQLALIDFEHSGMVEGIE